MARVDYGRITLAMDELLSNDHTLINNQVTVQRGNPPNIQIGMMPHIGIYEQGRRLAPGQSIAAGQRTRYLVNWELWITTMAGRYEDAVSLRDELIGQTEIALTKDRTLQGTLGAASLLLTGGALRSGPGSGGFIAEGSIGVVAEVEMSTV